MLSLPLLFFECCLLLFFLPFTTALQTFLQPRSPRAYSFYHNHYRFPEKSLTSPSCLYASLVEGEDGFIDNRDNGIPKKQFTSRPNDLIFKMQKIMKDKGFSKASIAKLGGYALLSYGFVSNVSYITCIIISWVIHGRVNKLSPLAAGQWKPFLAIYAGLWAVNNVLRPLRFSLSVLIAPYFENLIQIVERRTGFKRASCVAITVFLVNIVGTTSYLALGLLLATSITRVPLLP